MKTLKILLFVCAALLMLQSCSQEPYFDVPQPLKVANRTTPQVTPPSPKELFRVIRSYTVTESIQDPATKLGAAQMYQLDILTSNLDKVYVGNFLNQPDLMIEVQTNATMSNLQIEAIEVMINGSPVVVSANFEMTSDIDLVYDFQLQGGGLQIGNGTGTL